MDNDLRRLAQADPERVRHMLLRQDDHLPPAETPCRLGWTAGCPYRSCERAGSCQAPRRINR